MLRQWRIQGKYEEGKSRERGKKERGGRGRRERERERERWEEHKHRYITSDSSLYIHTAEFLETTFLTTAGNRSAQSFPLATI